MPTPEELYRLNFPEQSLSQSYQGASDAVTNLDSRLGSIQDQIDAEIRMLALRGQDPFQTEAVPGLMGQPRPTETTPEQLRLLMGGRDPFQRHPDTYNPLQLHSSQLPRELTAEEMKGPPLSLIQQHLQQGGFDPNTDLTYAQKVGLSRGAVDAVGEMAKQRQMSAYQAQQLQFAREKESWDQAFGVATNKELSYDQRMLGLKDLAKTSPIAARFAQGLTTKLLGDLDAYGQYMPQDEAFYKQGLMSGEFGFDRVAADLDIAKQTSQLITKAKAPMQLMQNLQAIVEKDPQNTAAKDALATLKAEQEEKQSSSKIKQAQASVEPDMSQAKLKKMQREAEAPLATTQLGHDREAITQEMFQGKYGPGVLYKQLNPDEQTKVNTVLMDRQGQLAERRAYGTQRAQLQVPDKPSQQERRDMVEDLTTIGQLDVLQNLYDPVFVGPIAGRYGSMTEVVGLIGEDEATFRAQVASIKNQTIKLITGAQMSEPEAIRIMKQIPDTNNPPSVFQARLKQTRANIVMMAKKRREILGKSGIYVDDLPAIPELPQNERIKNALDQVLGGQ